MELAAYHRIATPPLFLRDKIHLIRSKPYIKPSTIRQYLSTMNSLRLQLGDDLFSDPERTALELCQRCVDGRFTERTLYCYFNTLCVFSPSSECKKIFYDARGLIRDQWG